MYLDHSVNHVAGLYRLDGIEIDLEVLGREHAEVEAFVLHLVAAEVLRVGRRGMCGERRSGQHAEGRNPPVRAPDAESACVMTR
jgi:hypothetical protein